MKRTLIAIAALLLLSVLAACGTNADQDVVAKGSSLQVRIEGNPTTGYEWTCTTDDAVVRCTDSSYAPSQTDKHVVGAGGEYTFSFRGVAGEGTRTTVIEFTYARSWEAGSACRWRSVTVEVAPNGGLKVLDVVDTTL